MTSSDKDYINCFLTGISQIADEVSREDIEAVISLLFDAWQHDCTVFLVGNGGSAATASHFAADLNMCTRAEGKKRMKAISLVDNMAQFSALTNDCGWENVFTEQLGNFFQPGDIVLALSVHGGSGSDRAGAWSQNLLKAMQYAKDNGGKTIGLSGFDGGPMRKLADASIVVPYNTTPHVEAFHVVLHHLIAFRLQEKVSLHGK